MLRNLTLLLLVSTIGILRAQTETSEKFNKTLYVGASANFGVSNTTGYIGTSYAIPYFAYTNGFILGTKLTSLLSLETGIRYTQKQSSTKSFTPYYYEKGFCSTWDAPYTVTGTYKYLDIPLMLNLTFGKKKMQGIVSAGTDLNILLERKILHLLSPADNSPTEEYKDYQSAAKFNLSPTLGIGISYQFSSLLCLRVMPVAQIQALNNLKKDRYHPLGSERIWSVGISSSITFGFNSPKAKTEAVPTPPSQQ